MAAPLILQSIDNENRHRLQQMPSVSICIPTYNGAEHLRQCLESVLNQSHTAIEILCIDDCSSDETPDLLLDYSKQDNRIRVEINKKNLGLVGNWNQSIELARGEWIKFVFQDDFVHPECVERMLLAAHGRPLIACMRDFVFEQVSDDVRAIYKRLLEEHTLVRLFPGMEYVSPAQLARGALDNYPSNFVGEPTAVMFRKDVATQFGLFNPNFVQLCDYEYWLRVGLTTGIVIVPEVLASFRVHGGSTTQSNNSAGKKFRSTELEHLLLLNEFATNPAFLPLRRYAERRSPLRSLRYEVARKAIWCENYAERCAAQGDTSALSHWSSITAIAPSLMNSPYHWLVRAQAWLEKRLLWRLRGSARRDA